jgi:single-strand DNA-binding protein
MNRATLVGNIGSEPEIKVMSNGKKMATFSLATSESWKDRDTGEKKTNTDWHRVVIWNEGVAGIVERFLKKGSKVLIEGKVCTRKYEKNGVDTYTTEIVLQGFDSKLLMLGEVGGSSGQSNAYSKPVNKSSTFDDIDIPF